MIDLKSRRIKFLRTHIDPSIGTMPRNAFNFDDMQAHAEVTPIGVYVKIKTGEEYLVPFSNIQAIRFLSEKPPEKKPLPKDLLPPEAGEAATSEVPAKG